jgi:hypothetical protein
MCDRYQRRSVHERYTYQKRALCLLIFRTVQADFCLLASKFDEPLIH